MKKNLLKRRTLLKSNNKARPEYIIPSKSKKTFGNTAEYKYFWGHVVKEIAEQLPNSSVICWYDDHTLSLPICAVSKFLKEKKYCKRCPLFQGDEHSGALRLLIENWEHDDLEEPDAS